jgi:hypothetical protein
VTIFFCDSGLFYLFNATLKQKWVTEAYK